ncbi:probable protein S-acyltransferase 15 isoform X2 [Euphorbia lathyris]|uniref:probable protein S-acyltransferase 15 isoform X2 n=1 Tax=Euphorbia lathyris TaxID=212925 RepID=UPI00331380CF
MQGFTDHRTNESISALIGRSTVSCILVIFTQFTLSLVPRFFYASSLLLQLSLSALLLLLVLGFGRWCKRLLGVYSSASALVFYNIIFLWCVYFIFVRQATSRLIDVMFQVEVAMLLVGLRSILSSDPGFVNTGSLQTDSEIKPFEVEAQNEFGSLGLKRIRYCKSCKAYVKGFDHHCPAFGNCIGQNNHVLFIVLLLGFLCTEATYIMCSFQFVRASHVLNGTKFEIGLAGSLVISTLLFALLQVLWQGIFMAWHVYCICFNIKTDEWKRKRKKKKESLAAAGHEGTLGVTTLPVSPSFISHLLLEDRIGINWKKYPEFQITIESQPGGSFTIMRYTNPYDKGIIQNVKEFSTRRD